ncbi:hypothetical protein FUAX_09290 [Fulvitalea axinellae]|uniref:FecR family protein n=1 Tax=Fulvitalea axinellae TaxID=1182444 RepID=A0AAU9CSX4_9BACT|nr:hypothetical protein FUAX_09290 [Fulvitalea axinellae]
MEHAIKLLAESYLEGENLSPSDLQKLHGWINANEENEALFAEMVSARSEKMEKPFPALSEEASIRAVHDQIGQLKSRRIQMWWDVGVAAAIAVLFVFILNGGPAGGPSQRIAMTDEEEVVKLTLSDGTVMLLEEESDSLGQSEGNGFVRTREKSGLAYQKKGFQSIKEKYNTVKVPSGKRFSITLSDGTIVTLNSETELRYPVVFKGMERNIELLSGEIYCDVAKNKDKPFYVNSDRLRLRVLGTSFNFSAYKNENRNRTVLVEGRVAIMPRSKFFDLKKAVALEPGQSMVYDKTTKKVVMETVDVGVYTSWKDGKLIFQDVPLVEILPRLSRWYGRPIEDRTGRISSQGYSGILDKESFDEAILGLSKLCSFQYRYDGEKVIVE